VSRRLGDGDLEVDGLLNLDDFEDEAGFALPEGPYETVAGFVLASLGHIPAVGEIVEVAGHRITVSERDGRRVSRLLVARLDPPTADEPAGLPQ
jgi:putative hemolysin